MISHLFIENLQQKRPPELKNVFLCMVNRFYTNFITIEMKKNSPISLFAVILHAFNERGFFAAPLCPVFSVRPVPFWVRR
jgi:hypothetical protein